jgi:uncharacterized membrane protein
MKAKKSDILILLVNLASFVGLALLLPRLPETIPIHWNFKSQADNWGPRWMVLLMGALPLGIFIMMKILPLIDPRKESYRIHAKAYSVMTIAVSLVFIPIAWVVALAGLQVQLDVGIITRLFIGLLFIILGNYMGKLRPNFFVGIRTPWTLSNAEVWQKTHRRGAWIFVLLGLIFWASLIQPHNPFLAGLAIGAVILGTLYIILYSYILFYKLDKGGRSGYH